MSSYDVITLSFYGAVVGYVVFSANRLAFHLTLCIIKMAGIQALRTRRQSKCHGWKRPSATTRCPIARHRTVSARPRTLLVYEGNKSHVIKNMAATVKFEMVLRKNNCAPMKHESLIHSTVWLFS